MDGVGGDAEDVDADAAAVVSSSFRRFEEDGPSPPSVIVAVDDAASSSSWFLSRSTISLSEALSLSAHDTRASGSLTTRTAVELDVGYNISCTGGTPVTPER